MVKKDIRVDLREYATRKSKVKWTQENNSVRAEPAVPGFAKPKLIPHLEDPESVKKRLKNRPNIRIA